MNLKEQAINLYKIAFPEDSEAFIETFFDRFFEKDCRYVLKDGKLVSMLFLLDATLQNGMEKVKGKYLYAAATLPDFRGQGLMSKLIENAKIETVDKGDFLLTKPAEPSLFGYYERFGFKTVTKLDERVYKLQNKADPLPEISLSAYLERKQKLLLNTPYLTLSDTVFLYDDMSLFGNENTLAAVDMETDVPQVKEFVSKHEKGKDSLLSALGKNEAIFREEGSEPFAMIISEKDLKSICFTLALD